MKMLYECYNFGPFYANEICLFHNLLAGGILGSLPMHGSMNAAS
jgi:hypothetical protein